MSVKIARMGHPILAQVAQEIQDVKNPVTQKIAKELTQSFYELKGTGLAAPQIFHSVRMMIIEVSQERAQRHGYSQAIPFTLLINPKIEYLTNETELTWEACFSLPGFMGKVPRCKKIRYHGITLDGDSIQREVDGFHAFIFQHEYDHLDGILYPMRMNDLSLFGYASELKSVLPQELVEEF